MEKNIKIVVYVHDLYLEIGHSNALIESIRNFPQKEIEQLHLVCFKSDDPEKLFPELRGKVKLHKVPFPNLKPFLFKAIFYHIWTFFYDSLLFGDHFKKIGLGTACLRAKYINIQFVQSHWAETYFRIHKLSPIAFVYKKLHFYYNILLEDFMFNLPGVKFSVLAQFEVDFIKKRYALENKNIITNYSSVNTKRFSLEGKDRLECFNYLKDKHEEIAALDINKVIYLFVGAYQRKGLSVILNKLRPGDQLIVVGKSEKNEIVDFPEWATIVKVPFSNEINRFYELCDVFLFPSIYEPFGLVIMEAAICGMQLGVTSKNVGAVELLHDLEGVFIFDSQEKFDIPKGEVLTIEKRKSYREERIQRIEQFSWKKCGENLYHLMKEEK